MKLTCSLRSFALIGLLTLWLGITGCSKITRDNYDKIQVGMNVSDVKKILGDSKEKTNSASVDLGIVGFSGETLIWRENQQSITIVFVNDQVMMKSQAGL
jgi:Domain of Unknown Function with PDB structure (DUF3862)